MWKYDGNNMYHYMSDKDSFYDKINDYLLEGQIYWNIQI